jgi:uncharacterized protein (TIGR03437 family)
VEQDEALTYNYKTGPSSGLVIQNNIIDQALGYGEPTSALLTGAAAINVVAYDQRFAWVATTPFSNISITGNFVGNTVRTGIRMENVAGGQITGNTVLNYALQPNDYLWFLPACCETLAQVQAEFMQPVVVTNSNSVNNSGNTTVGSWVSNVSYADGGRRLAPESIAVANGGNLASESASDPTLPTELGGITVTVMDSAGVSQLAGLYSVSPNQVEYVVPAGAAPGVATVMVGSTVSAALIASVAPGLFSADGSGTGVAAATAVRTSGDGTETPVTVYQCGSSGCASVPMELGSSTDVLTVQFAATGIRGFSSLTNLVAEIGGAPAQVVAAGPQAQMEGADQVSVVVPSSLAGAG